MNKKFNKEELMEFLLQIADSESEIQKCKSKLRIAKRALKIRHKNFNTMPQFESLIHTQLNNKEEELEVFKKCLENQQMLLSYFDNSKYDKDNKEKRKLAFEALLNYPDEILGKLVPYNKVINDISKREIKIIFEKHGEYLFDVNKNSVIILYKYCLLFKDHITDEHRQVLVNGVCRKKMINYMNILRNNDWLQLTDNMKEQIESIELAMKLFER